MFGVLLRWGTTLAVVVAMAVPSAVAGAAPAFDDEPVLAAALDGPDAVSAGRWVDIELSVANTGSAEASGVKVAGEVPSTYPSVIVFDDLDEDCLVDRRTFTCRFETLDPRAEVKKTLHFTSNSDLDSDRAVDVRVLATASGAVADYAATSTSVIAVGDAAPVPSPRGGDRDNPPAPDATPDEINWPPDNGFDGESKIVTLEPGDRVDRYGHPGGTFVAEAGTPYEQRALVPGSDEREFHTYEVVRPFDAEGGLTAPWFGEPGGGIQYLLPDRVQRLIDNGYLREV
ncbi:TNT domain-containing protein [Salininema proteolyticum]|uniref:Glycohydrolase toxin TNT-related protein n=1 Tax=Salininema proteolyticum TaxID=1607685 RepID=A0ABV8TVF1_9ACTN